MFEALLQLFYLIQLPQACGTLISAFAEVGFQALQLLILGGGEGMGLGERSVGFRQLAAQLLAFLLGPQMVPLEFFELPLEER